MNIATFLNPLYWLTTTPAVVDGVVGKVVLGGWLLLFVVSVVSRMVTRRYKSEDRYMLLIGQKVSNGLLLISVLGLALFFFSFEQIPFFGGRFWYPLLGVGIIVWIVRLVRFVNTDVMALKVRDAQNKERAKYLSHKKR